MEGAIHIVCICLLREDISDSDECEGVGWERGRRWKGYHRMPYSSIGCICFSATRQT